MLLALAGRVSAGEDRGALHCLRIRDAGAVAARDRTSLGAQLPEGCRIRSRAALACAPASLRIDDAPAGAETLLFDRLCYEVECRGSTGNTQTDEAVLTDALGTRSLRDGAPSMVCTPAEIAPASVDGETSGARGSGRRAGIAGGSDGEVAFLACGDFNADGSLSATDALGILKTAVGSASGCLPCVCDVDNNGNFTATDALTTLKKAVGQNVTLNCRPDGNPVQWTGSTDNRSWHLPGNWNSNRVPDYCDAVSIPQPGLRVFHSEGTNTARSIASNAELEISGGSLALRDTVQVNDTFAMSGGALIDAVVLAPTGSITGAANAAGDLPSITMTTSGGLLNNVTLNDALDLSIVGSSIRIENGLVLNSTATMGNASNIQFQGAEPQTLEGTGEVVFGTVGNKTIFVNPNSSLTIAPGMVIRGGIGQVGSSGPVTNEGTIDSDEPGDIEITSTTGWTNESSILGRNGGGLRLSGTWTNNASVSMADGGTLNLLGAWSNAGTITSDASIVNLGGTFTLAALGDFQRTGGTVNLTGTFDNSADLLLDATTGSWNLIGGTVVGGSIASADGSNLVFTTSGGLLDGVTMDAPMDLTTTGVSVRIENGLVLNSTADMGNATNMQFQGSTPQTIEGTGAIVFGTVGNKTLFVNPNSSLTIAPGMVIRGGIGQIGSSGPVTNQGTIDSDEPGEIEITSTTGWTNESSILGRNGGGLRLSGTWTNNASVSMADGGTLNLLGTWNNAGTITSDASTVNLGGNFSLAALGDFQRTGGTVNLTGTFDNSANLLLDATTGNWNLLGGTVVGGSINAAGGASLVLTTSGGLLDGVTMDAPMDLTTTGVSVRIENGLVLNSTADMGNATNMQFQGSTAQTIEGTGEIVFGTVGNKTLFVNPNSSLTIAPGMVIRGGIGQIGSSGPVTNQGTIDSDEPGEIEITSTAGWTNEGTFRASGGNIGSSGNGTNAGQIEIGAGFVMNARNGFQQSGAGTLSLDIGSSSSFGRVVVTGAAAALNGTLDINLTGGFDPAIGETFTIMTFTSSTGDFTTVTGLDIGGGKQFQRTVNATNMVLEVVSQ